MKISSLFSALLVTVLTGLLLFAITFVIVNREWTSFQKNSFITLALAGVLPLLSLVGRRVR